MSETITLEPGARVRQAGQSYKVTEQAVIDAKLEPVKSQKNRHMAVECQDEECRAKQIAKRGKIYTGARISNVKVMEAENCWPACGLCFVPMKLVVVAPEEE